MSAWRTPGRGRRGGCAGMIGREYSAACAAQLERDDSTSHRCTKFTPLYSMRTQDAIKTLGLHSGCRPAAIEAPELPHVARRLARSQPHQEDERVRNYI